MNADRAAMYITNDMLDMRYPGFSKVALEMFFCQYPNVRDDWDTIFAPAYGLDYVLRDTVRARVMIIDSYSLSSTVMVTAKTVKAERGSTGERQFCMATYEVKP